MESLQPKPIPVKGILSNAVELNKAPKKETLEDVVEEAMRIKSGAGDTSPRQKEHETLEDVVEEAMRIKSGGPPRQKEHE